MIKRYLLVLPLAALLAGQTFIIGSSINNFVQANFANANQETPLKPEYKVGETVQIPNRNIKVNNQEYPTQKVVIAPDGKAFDVDTIKVDVLGVYKVEYRAKVNGKLYVESASFETYNDLYSLDGKAAAVYGKETRYETGIDGLHVTLHDGEEIRFNEIIDLRKFNYETPFIDLFATPNELGVRDVHAFTLRLTDAYDDGNYVTIDCKSVNTDGGSNLWWMNFMFVAAGPVGNSLKGIEWGKNLVHTDNSFGFPIKYSLYGTIDAQNSVGTNFFQLCYDLNENKIYGPNGKADNYAIDLDDPLYFPNGWKGFKTGEVYLSIKGKGYYTDSFNFTLKKLGNCDLSQTKIYNDSMPTIEIDCDEIPAAGLNNPYPVFAAKAYDGYSGELNVTKKVFYNYYGDNRYELPIVNGKFTPTQKGTYVIEYSAVDGAGNETVETISVYCDGSSRTLGIELESLPSGGKTGLPIKLATVKTSGGIGKINVKSDVLLNDKIVSTNKEEFTPNIAGTYVVKVTATDLAGQIANKEYSFVVTQNDKPVIPNASLPDYFIEKSVYNIPSLVAYFEKNKEYINCDVTVNGAKVENGYYEVPENTSTVNIVYKAKDATKTYQIPVIKYTSPSSMFVTEGVKTDSIQGVTLENANFVFANQLSSQLSINVNVSAGSKLTLGFVDLENSKAKTSVSLNVGKHIIEYSSSKETIIVDGVETANVKFSKAVKMSGEISGECTFESINNQSLRNGASKNKGIFSVNGTYNLKVSCGEKLEILDAKTYYVLKNDDRCNVTLLSPKGEEIISNALANKTYSVDITSEGEYTLIYTSGNNEYVYRFDAVNTTPPVINVAKTPAETAKIGAEFIVSNATATDDTDGNVSVEIYVIAPSGMIKGIRQCCEKVTENGFVVKFKNEGTYTIRYFALDSNGNYAVKEFKVKVTA